LTGLSNNRATFFSIAIFLSYGGAIGLGHLKRMLSLARALDISGYSVVFLTNRTSAVDDSLIHEQGFSEVVCQSSQTPSNDFTSSVVQTLKQHPLIQSLIIDDYSIGLEFENAVIDAGYKVIAIDDIQRRHAAGLIVDTKWRGKVKTGLAYQGLVPDSCRCLLGPKYYLFDTSYSGCANVRSNHGQKGRSFSIIISLGGVPDLSLLKKIVEDLSHSVAVYADMSICPVLGSQTEGVDDFLVFCDSLGIESIQNAASLQEYYQSADIFVGAAGGSVYEAMLCGIPAVTFILADNQKQDKQLFEDIGHEHHFNQYYDECRDQILGRVISICNNYDNALLSLETFKQYYDGRGVYRVAKMVAEYDQQQ